MGIWRDLFCGRPEVVGGVSGVWVPSMSGPVWCPDRPTPVAKPEPWIATEQVEHLHYLRVEAGPILQAQLDRIEGALKRKGKAKS